LTEVFCQHGHGKGSTTASIPRPPFPATGNFMDERRKMRAAASHYPLGVSLSFSHG